MSKQIIEALTHSNYIENEFSVRALADALDCWANWCSNKGKYSLLDEFATTMIKSIHRNLMQIINPKIAGYFRNHNVEVGGYIAPDYFKVSELIMEWADQYGKANTWDEIKKGHIAFEKIHPFADGNGRVGRMIMYLQQFWAYEELHLIGSKDINHICHYTVDEYYKWFK